MKRGEIWTVSGGADHAGKPRPAVIVQDDAFEGTLSVTLCAFTTDPTEAPLMRLIVEPSAQNGLRSRSSLMVDKITTVPRSRLGSRVGELADRDLARLNQAALVFLGLATPRPRTSSAQS
jgi:mRNA interferase MazF